MSDQANERATYEALTGDQPEADEPAVEGYDVPNDVLDRMERLVGIIAEPIVAFSAELAAERDEARERAGRAETLSNRLLKALQVCVAEWPETSWLTANEARDSARLLLDEVSQGATMGSAEPPTQTGA
jgi:hypothetical protein